MKINTGPVGDWLGYTRGERRATIVLLIVIFIISLIRYGFPSRSMVVEESVLPATRDPGQVGGTAVVPESAESIEEPFKESVSGAVYTTRRSSHSGFSKGLQDTMTYLPGRPGGEQLIDINSCDTADLIKLRGIGPVLSARIIKYRKLIGGYASIEQLREVYGLSEDTFLEIRDRIWADTTLIRKININTAGYRDLCRIPYLEKYDVSSVLKYRELKGRIGNMEELVSGSIIGPEKAARASPYIIFDQH